MSKSKVNLWETHTSTVLSITLVLFLLGLCLMVEYHTYRASHDMQERITFNPTQTPPSFRLKSKPFPMSNMSTTSPGKRQRKSSPKTLTTTL